jgi:hypothetical protein
VISINPPQLEKGDNAKSQEPEAAWNVFNALCQKVGGRIVICFTCSVLVQTLMSANHILHRTVAFIICPAGILFTYVPADGEIKRDPVILGDVHANSPPQDSYPSAFGSMRTPPKIPKKELPVALRREYVWRNMDRGQESLATIAHEINRDLNMNISRLDRSTPSNGRSPHRCFGYIRE